MKITNIILALSLSLSFFTAQAQEAKPLTAEECREVLVKMSDLQSRRQTEQAKVTGSLRENANVMNSWYESFSTYEGKTTALPPGLFDVIAESASIVDNNAQISSQNFALLDKENDMLMALVQRCIR